MRSTIATTAARRRTDLMPTIPLSQDSPRQRSPGETPLRPKNLSASLHEPRSSLSKSMSHIGPRYKHRLGTNGVSSAVESRPVNGALDRRTSRSSLVLSRPRLTRAETLKLSKLRASTTSSPNNNIKGRSKKHCIKLNVWITLNLFFFFIFITCRKGDLSHHLYIELLSSTKFSHSK